ncbi:MAG: polyprenyl synthetase family protein [Candidatus Latescibacterota bacterium]
MIGSLHKYAVLQDVIANCNNVVINTLKQSTIREAEISLESFKNGGKRLRPALVILSSLTPNGGSLDNIDDSLIELAGAVELIHLSTLFHDDVIDEVDYRRQNMSARAKYGNHASVLAGDFALAEALDLVSKSRLSHTMPEFLRTIRVLVRGESLETVHKFNFDINEATYYEIISEKSASLFSLSCKVGALGQRSEFADTLGHFGWNLGMAFQMIDDLDDMLAHPNQSFDCDLRNGYLSLPVIKALNNLEDGNRDRLVKIIRDADFSPANELYIVSLCSEMGTIQQSNAAVYKHLENAAGTLTRFRNSDAKELMACIISDLRAYTDNQARNFVNFMESA